MKRADRTADRCLMAAALCAAGTLAVLSWFLFLRPRTPALISIGALALATGVGAFPLYRRRIYARVLPRKVFFVTLALAGPVVCVEALANLLDPGGYLYFADAQRYFAGQRYDGLPDHEHPPYYSPHLRWGPVQINEYGWRGAPIEEQKPAGVLRIAGLGDSVLFGWGLGEEEALGTRVEAHLSRKAGRHVQILNTGHGSFGSLDELLVLKQKVLPLAPDAVFVLVVGNDFLDRPPYHDQVDWLEEHGTPSEAMTALRAAAIERPSLRGPESSLARGAYLGVSYLLNRSFLLTAALLGAQGRSLFPPSSPISYPSPVEPDRSRLEARYRYLAPQLEALLEIERTCRDRGMPLAFFVETKDPELDAYLEARLGRSAVIPLRIPEGSLPTAWTNSAADPHWNAQATDHFAKVIARSIQAELLKEK